MKILVLGLVGVLGCSSGGGEGGKGESTNLANPCATKGATYLLRAVEQRGGTCGPIPDQILNINPDGTIPGPALTCEVIRQDGCTARNTNCTSSSNGVTCKATTSVTFAEDGASATGLITQSCTDGSQSCLSTYAVMAKRQ